MTYNTAGCVTALNRANKVDVSSLNWDSQYQLTSAVAGNIGVYYSYDALGRKIERLDGDGGYEYYFYDGNQIVADFDGNEWRVIRSYTYGPGIDNILSMTVHGSTSTNTYYYLKDLSNTVLSLVNASGIAVEYYEYDAYGNVTIRNGSGTVIPTSAYGNRFLFQGREYDYTTQLYHFRARWYDPETGRWLSNDPIGISGGLNLYAFCSNDPVNFVDPMGLAIVKNKTSWPIVVSGGLGEGRGHENPTPYYAVVPPGGVGGGKYNPLPAYPTPAEAVAAYSNRAKTPSKPSDILLYDVDYSHDFACNLKNMNSKPTTSEKLVGNDEFLVYDISVTDCGETDYNIDYLSSSILVLLYGIEIYEKYTPKSDKFYFHP
jgi:RHS repeat-associated protein